MFQIVSINRDGGRRADGGGRVRWGRPTTCGRAGASRAFESRVARKSDILYCDVEVEERGETGIYILGRA